MLRSNLIAKTSLRKGLRTKNGYSNVDAHNTDNPVCMNDNGFDEPDVFHIIVTPNSKGDERPKKKAQRT